MTLRKKSGAIVCPSCGKLISVNASACPYCDAKRPGVWGFGPSLLKEENLPFQQAVFAMCFILYAVSLVAYRQEVPQGAGLMSFLTPTNRALVKLGASGTITFGYFGRWETLVTAIFLHGGLMHIGFNLLWLRNLAPVVQGLYGPARFFLIFFIGGVLGNLASCYIEQPGILVGASGGVFGLFGALIWYGKKRGGVVGAQVLRFSAVWAGLGLLLSLAPGLHISFWAHAGGFAGGFVSGVVFEYEERKRASPWISLLAIAAVLLVFAAFFVFIKFPPPGLEEMLKNG